MENAATLLTRLDRRRKTCRFSIKRIPFHQLDQWRFERDTGNLVHSSGQFFSIEGVRVSTNFGPVNQWEQPIIFQPEVGILGIIVRKIDGAYHFLMQCKAEPGNPNILQLAPTVQATVSNYTKVHNGQAPLYLEYFLEKTNSKPWIDLLQTGQGARFFQKQNRNMIVEVKHPIEIFDGYYWLTLPEIRKLLVAGNVINDEARSVFACLPLKYFSSVLTADRHVSPFSHDLVESMHDTENQMMSRDRIFNWIGRMKSKYFLDAERINIRELNNWHRNTFVLSHISKPFFSIIAVSVHTDSREVSHWTQPLIADTQMGLAGYIVKKINNVLHFLVQAKVEPGNLDAIGLAPTVLCSSAGSRGQETAPPPFLSFFSGAGDKWVRYNTIQSEEGGRFFCVQNRYRIVEVDKADITEIPDNYAWMTLRQLMKLVARGYLNIYARSILAYAIMS